MSTTTARMVRIKTINPRARRQLFTRDAPRPLAMSSMRPMEPFPVPGAIAEIVHDLKAPLSTMLLEAALLEQRLDERHDVESCVRAQRLIRSVKFLDRLVEDLLDVSTLAGEITLSCQDIEVRALIERVVERVVSSRDAHRVSVEPGSEVHALADARQIERVLGNLVDNALKYTESLIVIAVQVMFGEAVVSVTDAGPGIEASELAGLFEPYRRGSSSRGRAGSGLGLCASKKIVEAHGGRIVVESEQRLGSCFCFTLPMIT